MHLVGWIITAETFHDRAGDGVADEVSGEHLPVEFFVPEKPGQKKVKNEIVQRVVNLRRMHRRAMSGMIGGKPDGPGQAARAAVAAAIEQAADTAENISQRDAWREHVGGSPQRHFFPAQVNKSGEDRADQPAVINQPAVLNHENFRERLVGEFVLPIRRHIDDARADDGAEHQPQDDIGDFFAGDVFAAGAAGGRPKPGEEGQRNHHAIPMDCEGAELKRNRMHEVIYDLRFTIYDLLPRHAVQIVNHKS